MKQNLGLSGSTLKIIAAISMLIDHIYIAAFDNVYIDKKIPVAGLYLVNGSPNYKHWMFTLGKVMRGIIGRIAFPVFCFLLVQGFVHTSNKHRYKLRLLIFALLSEIPYNLVVQQKFSFGISNVLFTLLLGLIALELIQTDWHPILRFVAVTGVAIVSSVLKCDYGVAGVLLIIMLYFAKDNKIFIASVGVIAVLALPPFGFMSLLAYVLIIFYNGKKGLNLKYIFYVFYPAHLMVLHYISRIIVRSS